MNIESLLTFLLVIAPFAIAFFLEAMVVYFFKIRGFWRAIGVSVLLNLITLALIFWGVIPLLGQLNYEFDPQHLPLPVLLFLWWFSSVADGLLLVVFYRRQQRAQLFTAALVMNALSYLFLAVFIANSH